MVYQMPCPGKGKMFIASSFPQPEQALRDLQGWAAGNGYRLAAIERSFSVYGCDQQPRHWVLLERSAVSRPSETSRPSEIGR